MKKSMSVRHKVRSSGGSFFGFRINYIQLKLAGLDDENGTPLILPQCVFRAVSWTPKSAGPRTLFMEK